MVPAALDVLRECRVFAGISERGLVRVAEKLRPRSVAAGQPLMKQGEPSTAMYLLASGRVRVERSDRDATQPQLELAQLGPGEVVGEMGLLDGRPRSATVVAIQPVEAYELDAEGLTEVMALLPEVCRGLRELVTERLRETDALAARMLTNLLRRMPIFEPVSSAALARLAAGGQHHLFRRGEVLMRQGDASLAMYVIVRGQVQVERTHPHILAPVELAVLGPGEVVGEMGLLDGEPRSATARALEDVDAMEIDRDALGTAMLDHPELAAALLHIVTQRMRSTDQLLTELLRQYQTPDTHGRPRASRTAPHFHPHRRTPR